MLARAEGKRTALQLRHWPVLIRRRALPTGRCTVTVLPRSNGRWGSPLWPALRCSWQCSRLPRLRRCSQPGFSRRGAQPRRYPGQRQSRTVTRASQSPRRPARHICTYLTICSSSIAAPMSTHWLAVSSTTLRTSRSPQDSSVHPCAHASPALTTACCGRAEL